MTVLITLTIAGADSGPFDLYSDLDGYVSAFETGVSKAALLAGYTSNLVPDGTTMIRVKSNGVCTNYIDLSLTTTTTTTSSSTTTTTTTAFVCADCRNWEYNGATIPEGGDTILYYSCTTGEFQNIVLSNGDPTGNFCNCDSIGNPSSLNGTMLTQIGICTTTTTTTTPPPSCTDYYNNTGGTLNGINYTDCAGTPLTNQSVAPGQSFCAQDGSVNGGDSGFLITLGPC